MKRAIIIMVRVPKLGKVKTRLAADIGEVEALKVYEFLLRHTAEIAQGVAADVYVFYYPEVNKQDMFDGADVYKLKQVEGGLGTKMRDAFEQVFAKDYQQACIIGSDCYDLSATIVEEAFEQLANNDVVFGPAVDGGYYLLAQNRLNICLFQNVNYSTENTLQETINIADNEHLKYIILKSLSDVDFVTDITFDYQ